MPDFIAVATYEYDNFGGNWVTSPNGLTNPFGPLTYSDADSTFTIGEDFTGAGHDYMGYMTIGGVDYPVVTGPGGDTSTPTVLIPQGTDPLTLTFPDPVDTNNPGTSEFQAASMSHCFAEGTKILTPEGEVAVEELTRDHKVVTEDGTAVPVKWIGRQTLRRMFSGHAALNMVRITAGALGHGLPETDLTVTGDHGMIVDGLVVNASALVNDTTIIQIPIADLPERFTVYHVETENHDAILANGAAAETFVDVLSRANFDNHQEYLDLYGVERIVPEMARPRVSSRRLLPSAIKTRLGIVEEHVALDAVAGA